MSEALLGFECIKLDPDPRAPYRMTVDVYEGGAIFRYQLIGTRYERRRRQLGEIADVQLGSSEQRQVIAKAFDALDREYGEKLAVLQDGLQKAQQAVLQQFVNVTEGGQ